MKIDQSTTTEEVVEKTASTINLLYNTKYHLEKNKSMKVKDEISHCNKVKVLNKNR